MYSPRVPIGGPWRLYSRYRSLGQTQPAANPARLRQLYSSVGPSTPAFLPYQFASPRGLERHYWGGLGSGEMEVGRGDPV